MNSVTLLQETAIPERVGTRAAQRIADVASLFAEDMTFVDEELSRAVRTGLTPATDSAAHLLEAGGKRVRPLTVLLAASCFGAAPTQAVRELAVVAELVHLATLLHDDVIDDGMERRGHSTARRVWGNAVSVLAGDLLLTHALERTSAAVRHGGDASALIDLITTLRRLVDGEVVQLRSRSRLDLEEATYFRVVRDKTASLFAWAARVGARSGGASEAAAQSFGVFGEHVGIAFQLVDDCLDYAGDPELTGKTLLIDLHEGKVTLPLIRAVSAGFGRAEDVERAKTGDDAACLRLAQAVRSSGACEAVREIARDHTNRALAALHGASPEGTSRELLAAVARELTGRTK
ncbi:polyprenyl synthetase family protein [Pendulispora brunnea]|uniref:Polyprenyl synthetase family protein n=1 Tax=Pendulispora brunnea TaxID=2905690 RepID=A0ABZ2KJ82_9BACT